MAKRRSSRGDSVSCKMTGRLKSNKAESLLALSDLAQLHRERMLFRVLHSSITTDRANQSQLCTFNNGHCY